MLLLAIDTGSQKSAYVIVDTKTYKIEESGKIPNTELMGLVRYGYYDDCVIEMFQSYGSKAGAEVFESCVMIGRILEACVVRELSPTRIRRVIVKKHICNSINARDADVIRALRDRFGEKGTKKNKGWFYGVKADAWQAYALAVTYIDNLDHKNLIAYDGADVGELVKRDEHDIHA